MDKTIDKTKQSIFCDFYTFNNECRLMRNIPDKEYLYNFSMNLFVDAMRTIKSARSGDKSRRIEGIMIDSLCDIRNSLFEEMDNFREKILDTKYISIPYYSECEDDSSDIAFGESLIQFLKGGKYSGLYPVKDDRLMIYQRLFDYSQREYKPMRSVVSLFDDFISDAIGIEERYYQATGMGEDRLGRIEKLYRREYEDRYDIRDNIYSFSIRGLNEALSFYALRNRKLNFDTLDATGYVFGIINYLKTVIDYLWRCLLDIAEKGIFLRPKYRDLLRAKDWKTFVKIAEYEVR